MNMNRKFLTAKEMIELKLTNSPSTVKNTIIKSKREVWKKRKRKGKGGGYEYEIASMSKDLQIEILTKIAKQDAQKFLEKESLLVEKNYASELIWKRFDESTDKQKESAIKKLESIKAIKMLIDKGSAIVEAIGLISEQNNIPKPTLTRWFYSVNNFDESDWLAVLLPKHGRNRDGLEADFSEEAWEFFKKDYLRNERPQFGSCYERLKVASREQGWNIPSPSSVKRKIKREIPQTQITFLRDGAHALSQLYPHLVRSVEDIEAMEWINGDGYQHNVFVRWTNGEIVRPKTWLWQDVRTRKILSYRTDLSENSDTIRLSLMDLIYKFGIPKKMTIDNTRAAANKWLTAGVSNRYRFKVKEDDPLGIVPMLGIELFWTSIQFGKGHGQAKPIERAFSHGGLGELVDKHPLLAGHHAGDSILRKPDNYNYKDGVAYEDFIQALEAGIEQFNNRENRKTEICEGVFSFNQVFARDYQKAFIRKATKEQLRLLMLMSEAVTLKQNGTFELSAGGKVYGRKNRYFAEKLIGSHHKKVVIKFDPQNLHSATLVYSLDGIYLGEAICTEKVAFGDKAKGREHDKARKQFVKAHKQAAKAQLTMTAQELANALPDYTEEDAPKPNYIEILKTQGNTVKKQFVELDEDEDESLSEIEQGVSDYLKMIKG